MEFSEYDQMPVRKKDQYEEIRDVHGSAELRTERLILRKYRPEDAEELYRSLGTDPFMHQYTGWNPYASLEMAEKTVNAFISSYQNDHFYGWAIETEGGFVGTIGAYDYADDQIETGFSVVRPFWGRGYASEALRAVLTYLTENEGISRVTAWCAEENIGSRKVMEKAGMKFVRTEKDGIETGGKTYDKRIYEYTAH